jgi:hypothetical protein
LALFLMGSGAVLAVAIVYHNLTVLLNLLSWTVLSVLCAGVALPNILTRVERDRERERRIDQARHAVVGRSRPVGRGRERFAAEPEAKTVEIPEQLKHHWTGSGSPSLASLSNAANDTAQDWRQSTAFKALREDTGGYPPVRGARDET